MSVFVLLGFCILVIMGVALATFALLAILGLGFAGIISTSVIYGLYKRSLEKSFKAFMVLGFGFGGLVCGSILFPVINKIIHWTVFENALLIGITAGTLSGLLTGFVVFKILRSLTKNYAGKFMLK